MSKIEAIVNGWFNLAFKNKEVEEIATTRAAMCGSCTLNRNNMCHKRESGKVVKDFEIRPGVLRKKGDIHNGCGCPLSAKTRSMTKSNKCPLGKWEK